MNKIILALAAVLLLYSCNPGPAPDPTPQPGTTDPPGPTDLFSNYTYVMNGQTFTKLETKRLYTAVTYGIDDSFDRILRITCDEGNDLGANFYFAMPVIRTGFDLDTMNMTRRIKKSAYYTQHMAFGYSIFTPDTVWSSNLGGDDYRPSLSVTYTSMQDIGDITDSIYIAKGPYLNSKQYGTWDIYEATGTWIDSVRGYVQVPGEPDGFVEAVDKAYRVTGSFTIRFLKKQ